MNDPQGFEVRQGARIKDFVQLVEFLRQRDEVADRVFESFFTTKERGKGTGLGLAVSRRIVKEHGGRIGFTNNPGEGAVFWVILPAAVGTEYGDLDD